MFFWRAKKEEIKGPGMAENATVRAAGEPETKFDPVAETADVAQHNPASNVVTLPPSRLSERIAQTVVRSEEPATAAAAAVVVAEDAEPHAPAGALPVLPGQDRAFEALRFALSVDRPGFNVLVLGTPGTGRRTAIKHVLDECLAAIPRPKEWIYLADGGERALKGFELPAGEGAPIVSATNTALRRASAALERLRASDDYLIGLQVIDEELKVANDNAFDVLKRRAEAQNIALVKTPDGFVLAPMHEGRVVKADVFRALPEALQREVESKISGFESELKTLMAEVPEREATYDEKLAQLNREVALRALAPAFTEVRARFQASKEAADVLDMLQAELVERVVEGAHAKAQGKSVFLAAHLISAHAESTSDSAAPVVWAREATASAIAGEFGLNDLGQMSLKPGLLMRANGGILILEAWRIAAARGSWETLSSALEHGFVTPVATPGLVAKADPLPLSVRIILIADEASWAKLEALDPGIARQFPAVARFYASAPTSSVGEKEFAALASALARSQALKPVEDSAGKPLYADAVARAGRAGHVSLDLAVVAQLLIEADHTAGKSKSRRIRAEDIENAVRRRALWAPP